MNRAIKVRVHFGVLVCGLDARQRVEIQEEGRGKLSVFIKSRLVVFTKISVYLNTITFRLLMQVYV